MRRRVGDVHLTPGAAEGSTAPTGHRRYTEEQFREAVADPTVTTIAELCRRLGILPGGGNYESLRALAARLGIDLDGVLANRPTRIKPGRWPADPAQRTDRQQRRPLSTILRSDTPTNTARLRKRLIAEGILPRSCAGCGRTKWHGQPIPLELDHIDGDRSNNVLQNLRLLCPNCHALTPTCRGRNIGRR